MRTTRRLAALLIFVVATGGTASTESAHRGPMTAQVGVSNRPPSRFERVSVGVPRFKIEETSLHRTDELARDAADQLTTLAVRTERFDVIDRAQLEQLLEEQGLDDIVDPDQLAQAGRVKGLDYLFIGKITNMRIEQDRAANGMNTVVVGRETADARVTVECGVDLRLVNARTGAILAAEFSEFRRTDALEALGINVLGLVGDGVHAELDIDEDSRGEILRWALDGAVRKMLPRLDGKLR